jgi:hypothetical protein
MAAQTDQKGVLQTLYIKARKGDLCGVIQEVAGNRRHGKPMPKVSFLLSVVELEGVKHFILASTQFRTLESIQREMTPFASHDMTENDIAKLATSGFGGNLLPIKLNGTFSMLSSIEDGESFLETRSNWNLLEDMYISKMIKEIETDSKTFRPKDYEPRFHSPIFEDHSYQPFWFSETFRGKELHTHILEKNYKHFYICKKPNLDWNTELLSPKVFKELVDKLGEIYEIQIKNGELEFFYSYGHETPVYSLSPGNKILLHESNSMFTFKLDWALGDREVTELNREWWKNTFRYYNEHTQSYFYGKLEANGKDTIKDGRSRFNLKTVKNCEITSDSDWTTDITITIMRLHPDNDKHLTEAERAKYSNGVFIRIQDDILNEVPSYKDDTIRNLPGGYHYRLVVDIVSKKAKSSHDAGIDIDPYKKLTSINEKKSIALCIKRTILLLQRILEKTVPTKDLQNNPASYTTEEFYKVLGHTLDDRERAKDTKRSRDGIKYEAKLGQTLVEKYNSFTTNTKKELQFTYEVGDSLIMVNHDIKSQGIDILGTAPICEGKFFRILIQAKDKKQITQDDKKSFFNGISQLKEKYPNDIFLSVYAQKNVVNISSSNVNDFTKKAVSLLTGGSNDDMEACDSIAQGIKEIISNYNC